MEENEVLKKEDQQAGSTQKAEASPWGRWWRRRVGGCQTTLRDVHIHQRHRLTWKDAEEEEGKK